MQLYKNFVRKVGVPPHEPAREAESKAPRTRLGRKTRFFGSGAVFGPFLGSEAVFGPFLGVFRGFLGFSHTTPIIFGFLAPGGFPIQRRSFLRKSTLFSDPPFSHTTPIIREWHKVQNMIGVVWEPKPWSVGRSQNHTVLSGAFWAC